MATLPVEAEVAAAARPQCAAMLGLSRILRSRAQRTFQSTFYTTEALQKAFNIHVARITKNIMQHCGHSQHAQNAQGVLVYASFYCTASDT